MATSAFEEEVLTQPQALQGLLSVYSGPDSPLGRLEALPGGPPREVTFLGMGTSLFAAHPAVCRLNALGVAARAVDASEYLYYHWEDPRPGLLRVLISQSGQSQELMKAAERLAGKAPFVAITNTEGSPMAKAATVVLPMLGGPEKSTTNKTYTNSIAAGLALAAWIARRDAREALEPLRAVPQHMGRLLAGWREAAGPVAAFLGDPPHVDLLGRGPSLATVGQGSLILRELAHLKCAPMNAGLFRHGLVPSMKRGGAMIAFAPAGPTDALTVRLAEEAVSTGGRAVVVTSRSLAARDRLFPFLLPPTTDLHAPLLEILLIEMLGILYAEHHGMEPGEGIAKITPVE